MMTTEFPRLVGRVQAMERRSHANAPTKLTNEVPASDATSKSPDAAEVGPPIADVLSGMSSDFDDDDVIGVAVRKISRSKRRAKKRKTTKSPSPQYSAETIAFSPTAYSGNEQYKEVRQEFIPQKKKYPGHSRLDKLEQEMITIFLSSHINEYVSCFWFII
ncbi:hypothetical protein [Bartonella sp. TT29SHDZB]|uniref:hypothetical protein n=1 Tax=Bartonella sp. TT29SHDZB TaxID=3243581 RepID=UPI0035D13556